MTLVVVAHGSREPAGAAVAAAIVDAVRARLPALPVELAFATVREPGLPEVLRAADPVHDRPVVVVPAFLASGYHVRVDVPAQVRHAGRPDVLLARSLGPTPSVVAAVHGRLVEAGWRHGDPVVLAAAGSSDQRALADVRRAATLLSELIRQPVRIGHVTTARPSVDEAIVQARAGGGRVAVASWLLAPGRFHRWVARSGADLVAEPIGAHPRLVDQVIRRYRDALVDAGQTVRGQERLARLGATRGGSPGCLG
ncbi:MAG TPA: sirohydrochlorin chelatase [Pseudonocardiaceae bacterium]